MQNKIERQRRSKLQIHLSTALVLMFVVGILLHLNINGKQGKFVVQGLNGWNLEVSQLHGWPFCQEYMTEEENRQFNGFGDWVIPPFVYWFLDFWIAQIILAITWRLCEHRIRLSSKSLQADCEKALTD